MWFLDAFFIIQIWFTQPQPSADLELVKYILFIFALSFVCIPVFVNVLILHKEVTKWVHENESRDVIESWLLKYLKVLYIGTIVSGSSFGTVRMLNTNLFG